VAAGVTRVARPLHALTCLAAATHHAYELGAGVGLVFQPYLGMAGAGALWGLGFPAWFVTAVRGSRRWDPVLAYGLGMSLGGAALHFVLWPWELRRGLPVLTAAEGLRPGQLPAYNAIIDVWGLAAAAALARETPPGARRWALLGAATAFALRGSARRHFAWTARQAELNPAWWNRALSTIPSRAAGGP
jgi:hypothetical protein